MTDKYWVHCEGGQATVKLAGKVTIMDKHGDVIETVELADQGTKVVPLDADSLLRTGETYNMTVSLAMPFTGPPASNDG